jgi:hypothetical protein
MDFKSMSVADLKEMCLHRDLSIKSKAVMCAQLQKYEEDSNKDDGLIRPYVKNMAGSTIKCAIAPDATYGELRAMVAKSMVCDPSYVTMHHAVGYIIHIHEDHEVLANINIGNGSHITVAHRMTPRRRD